MVSLSCVVAKCSGIQINCLIICFYDYRSIFMEYFMDAELFVVDSTLQTDLLNI